MNDLYKYATIKDVEIVYEDYSKEELIECIQKFRFCYFNLLKQLRNQDYKINEIKSYTKHCPYENAIDIQNIIINDDYKE